MVPTLKLPAVASNTVAARVLATYFEKGRAEICVCEGRDPADGR